MDEKLQQPGRSCPAQSMVANQPSVNSDGKSLNERSVDKTNPLNCLAAEGSNCYPGWGSQNAHPDGGTEATAGSHTPTSMRNKAKTSSVWPYNVR